MTADKKEIKESNHERPNVNDEYLCAFRTKSYSDFFMKAQLLVHHSTSSPTHQMISEVLLNPNQETAMAILEYNKISYNLKPLFLNYFNISADASRFCSHLLQTLNQVQSDYVFYHKVLDSIDGDHTSHQDFDHDLRFCVSLKDPISDAEKQDFIRSHEKHSSVLQQLRSERKKVARKKKSLGILKKEFLRKVEDQLDVAAKGTYILNRDFDTMSRLVDRLQDEIEHSKMMIRLCLDRREDRVSNKVVKELKKGELGLFELVKEVEEHVYLCLLTINRGRALVVEEISSLV